MTVAIIRFGGSNCDRDTALALEHLGFDCDLIWFADGLPDAATGVVLPGGFAYGDYLRAGAMAARAPIMDEVRNRVADGLPVLGVCNGAQIGCEAGLTPGAFTTNAGSRFRCEHVHVRVETTDSPWTTRYDRGQVLELPIAHGEGRFEAPVEVLERLDDEDRVLLRYCEPDGRVTETANPNGSVDNIAGILGERRHVGVLMPHPERATLPDLGLVDGQPLLRGFAA